MLPHYTSPSKSSGAINAVWDYGLYYASLRFGFYNKTQFVPEAPHSLTAF
ncbi:hypothetical protein ACRRTK_008670 [Alexandromys fortis]